MIFPRHSVRSRGQRNMSHLRNDNIRQANAHSRRHGTTAQLQVQFEVCESSGLCRLVQAGKSVVNSIRVRIVPCLTTMNF